MPDHAVRPVHITYAVLPDLRGVGQQNRHLAGKRPAKNKGRYRVPTALAEYFSVRKAVQPFPTGQ